MSFVRRIGRILPPGGASLERPYLDATARAMALARYADEGTFPLFQAAAAAQGKPLDAVLIPTRIALESWEAPVFAPTSAKSGTGVLQDGTHLVRGTEYALSLLEAFPGFAMGVTNADIIRERLGQMVEQLHGRLAFVQEGPAGVAQLFQDQRMQQALVQREAERHPELDLDRVATHLPIAAQAELNAAAVGDRDPLWERFFPLLPNETQQAHLEGMEHVTIKVETELTGSAFVLDRLGKLTRSTPVPLWQRTQQGTEVRTTRESLGLELRLALSRCPAAVDALDMLAQNHSTVTLHRLDRTPPELLRYIKLISVGSQENTLGWLRSALIDDLPVHLREPARRELKTLQSEGTLAPDEALSLPQLQDMLERLKEASSQFVALEIRRADGSLQPAPEALTRALEPISREWAVRRMRFDNANERTEFARDLAKLMLFLGPPVEGLNILGQNVEWLKWLFQFGDFAAASADNGVALWGEYGTLKSTGYSNQEILKRFWPMGPAFPVVFYLAHIVEDLASAGQATAAGALYGFNAVALALLSSALSVGMFRSSVGRLDAEGRWPGTLPNLSRELRESKGMKGSLEEIRERVNALVRDQVVPSDEAELFLSRLEQLGPVGVEDLLRSPSKLSLWAVAVREDFSNPLRLGGLIGSAFAAPLGMGLGLLGLLHNGFAEVAVGAVESAGAVTTLAAAGARLEASYRRWLKSQLAISAGTSDVPH